ncbi:hypothetical protein [Parafilimonas sp.]|uniref:hypothetical protein n=1 Tax=Parafilimonas sp. TaxID=1969739 RepID=UPI003F7D3B88
MQERATACNIYHTNTYPANRHLPAYRPQTPALFVFSSSHLRLRGKQRRTWYEHGTNKIRTKGIRDRPVSGVLYAQKTLQVQGLLLNGLYSGSAFYRYILQLFLFPGKKEAAYG